MTNISATDQAWSTSTAYGGASSNAVVSSSDSSSSASSSASTSPPYISPATRVDPQTGIAVLVVLDDSGQVVEQMPSRQVIDEYRRHQEPSQDGQRAASSQASASPQPSPDQSGPQVAGAQTAGSGGSSSGSGHQGTFA